MPNVQRRVCVVVTARASYAKIKPILIALTQRDDVTLSIVCAASAVLDRFGRVEHQIEADGFTVNERIFMQLEAETLLTSAKSTGLGVMEFAGAFDRLRPDVVLVMADRFEVLAPAIAAAYQNIPLAHAQGGEVSGNIDEKVRHAITKLADLHFPATQLTADRLVLMGEQPDAVHWTGCPSIDIAEHALREPELGFDLYEKYGGVGHFPDLSAGYLIVMQHSVTTAADEAREQITETLLAIQASGATAIWFWPNPDAGSDAVSKTLRSFREREVLEKVHFIKNMEPLDFLRLLNASQGIVGNSSAAIREASFLGVPAINVGSRQMNRERGPNVIDVSHDRAAILSAIGDHCFRKLPSSPIYGRGDAGRRIAEVLATAPLTTTKVLRYVENEQREPSR